MKRLITDTEGGLDNSKVFWLVFWLIVLATNLSAVSHLSSIARSLRIMSAVSVPSVAIHPTGTVTLPLKE